MAISAPSFRPPAASAETGARATAPPLPGFAAVLESLVAERPLLGARIACTLPPARACAVLVEGARALGADIHWVPSSGVRADHAALYDWSGAAGPNLLLEHGAAVSRLIHMGTRREGQSRTAPPTRAYSAMATAVLGAAELSPRGTAWFARQSGRGELLYPAVDCTQGAALADLATAERNLEISEALSVALLALVSLFRAPPGGAALSRPSAAILRRVAAAHDAVVRARIEKLRVLAPGSGGSAGGGGPSCAPAA